MNATSLFNLTLVSACLSFTGCQSWQGAAFPLPNASRVPPPATGSYQLPSGYYNNSATSALPNVSPANQFAGNGTSLSSTDGRIASANVDASNPVRSNFSTSNFSTSPISSSNVQFSPSQMASTNGVSTASFEAIQSTLNNNALAPATDAQPMSGANTHARFTAAPTQSLSSSAVSVPQASGNFNSAASGRLNDATDAEVPSLQWQQFDGQ